MGKKTGLNEANSSASTKQKGFKPTLVALSRSNGEYLWHYSLREETFSEEVGTEKPVMIDGSLFFITSKKLYRVRKKDGKKIWSQSHGSPDRLYHHPDTFSKNKMLFSNGKTIQVRNINDGGLSWEYSPSGDKQIRAMLGVESYKSTLLFLEEHYDERKTDLLKVNI